MRPEREGGVRNSELFVLKCDLNFAGGKIFLTKLI